MQYALVGQQNSRVHRRARGDSHDQHIARLSGLHRDLLKADALGLCEEDAFARLRAFWPLVVRQLNALQLEPIAHERKAIGLAVLPLTADQGLIVNHSF